MDLRIETKYYGIWIDYQDGQWFISSDDGSYDRLDHKPTIEEVEEFRSYYIWKDNIMGYETKLMIGRAASHSSQQIKKLPKNA